MEVNDGLGTLGNGRYELRAVLGEGGMGRVYRAHDCRLDKDVVIKMPSAEFVDSGLIKRFERELRALILLAHPHIVPIIDVGQHEGIPFAVMSHLPGGSLRDRLNQDVLAFRTSAVHTLHFWLPAIAQALDHAHQHGFLHRDVKSANILFDDDGKVYLSDFGVAKALAGADPAGEDFVTTGGMVLGTPGYIAPEQVFGKIGDARSDQFSLAVTVYEALADQSPFQDLTPAEFVRRLTRQEVSLANDRPDLPATLVAAVNRAFAMDPARRFATCTDFAAAALADVPTEEDAAPGEELLQDPESATPDRIQDATRKVPQPGSKWRWLTLDYWLRR